MPRNYLFKCEYVCEGNPWNQDQMHLWTVISTTIYNQSYFRIKSSSWRCYCLDKLAALPTLLIYIFTVYFIYFGYMKYIYTYTPVKSFCKFQCAYKHWSVTHTHKKIISITEPSLTLTYCITLVHTEPSCVIFMHLEKKQKTKHLTHRKKIALVNLECYMNHLKTMKLKLPKKVEFSRIQCSSL